MRVFEFLHPDVALGDIGERTMLRLELGVPAELVDLATLLDVRLGRAQYLALLQHGITTVDQFEGADINLLADVLTVDESRVRDLQEIAATSKQQTSALVPLLPSPS